MWTKYIHSSKALAVMNYVFCSRLSSILQSTIFCQSSTFTWKAKVGRTLSTSVSVSVYYLRANSCYISYCKTITVRRLLMRNERNHKNLVSEVHTPLGLTENKPEHLQPCRKQCLRGQLSIQNDKNLFGENWFLEEIKKGRNIQQYTWLAQRYYRSYLWQMSNF